LTSDKLTDAYWIKRSWNFKDWLDPECRVVLQKLLCMVNIEVKLSDKHLDYGRRSRGQGRKIRHEIESQADVNGEIGIL
jgi:hypothetical protein